MFHGRQESVTLICRNTFAGVMIDRFGADVFMHPVDAEHFSCTATVNVSPQFFGWLTGLGEGVQVKTASVRKAYAVYLQKVAAQYRDCER